MTLILLKEPQTEPITLREIKTYLRIDHDEDDELLASLITIGRLVVEEHTLQRLITQTWRWIMPRWRLRETLSLPLCPLVRLMKIVATYRDSDEGFAFEKGGILDIPVEKVDVDASLESVRILFDAAYFEPWVKEVRLEIDMEVGYGETADQVPATLRQCIRMLVARWFEQRGDFSYGAKVTALGPDVALLLAPYRKLRL